MSQTMRQRAAIHAYIENGAHPDVLVREQVKRDAHAAIADFQAARLRYQSIPERELAASGVACCATEVADEAPALLGLVDIWRSEFGRTWPLWIGCWTLFLAVGVVSFGGLVWSYFNV